MMRDPERPPDGSTPWGRDLQFSVRFEAGCWLLDGRQCFETRVIPSGGNAETAARTMAARFAGCGRDVRVIFEDKLPAVVGTKLYFSCDAVPRVTVTPEGPWA